MTVVLSNGTAKPGMITTVPIQIIRRVTPIYLFSDLGFHDFSVA